MSAPRIDGRSTARKLKLIDMKLIELPPMREEDRGRPLTCREISERLGVSRARVQQIEQAAIKKLRKLAERRGLKFEDLISRPGDV